MGNGRCTPTVYVDSGQFTPALLGTFEAKPAAFIWVGLNTVWVTVCERT